MRTHESEEMYLETIYLLKRRRGAVRSIDVVEELGYAKSSVSRGVNLLQKKGYIEISHLTGDIEFTEEGLKKASSVYERHNVLTAALMKLGAPREPAENDACRIEHVISPEMFSIIKTFAEK